MRDSPWPLMVILPVLCGLPCSFSPELVTPSEIVLILLPSNLSSVTFYFSSNLSTLIIFQSNDIRINRLLLFQFLSYLTEEITHYLFFFHRTQLCFFKMFYLFVFLLITQTLLTILQIESPSFLFTINRIPVCS